MDLCAWKLGALLVASGLVGCAGSTVSPWAAEGTCDTQGAGGESVVDPSGGAGSVPLGGAGAASSTTGGQGGPPGAAGAMAARPEPRDGGGGAERVDPVGRVSSWSMPANPSRAGSSRTFLPT